MKGLNFVEIARQIGTSPSSVGQSHKAALEKLRKYVAADENYARLREFAGEHA
jgi:DNA-directed RNA polymerase specialized sigma subunit